MVKATGGIATGGSRNSRPPVPGGNRQSGGKGLPPHFFAPPVL